MIGFSRPMRLYPDLQRDFIGKGLKRFLFWTILAAAGPRRPNDI